jgi:hypothetical protein
MTARKIFTWETWLATRRDELARCNSLAEVETFREGMAMAYAASDERAECWRVPDEHRQAVARMVVERQQQLQRGR